MLACFRIFSYFSNARFKKKQKTKKNCQREGKKPQKKQCNFKFKFLYFTAYIKRTHIQLTELRFFSAG